VEECCGSPTDVRGDERRSRHALPAGPALNSPTPQRPHRHPDGGTASGGRCAGRGGTRKLQLLTFAPGSGRPRHKLRVLRRHCEDVGRDYEEIRRPPSAVRPGRGPAGGRHAAARPPGQLAAVASTTPSSARGPWRGQPRRGAAIVPSPRHRAGAERCLSRAGRTSYERPPPRPSPPRREKRQHQTDHRVAISAGVPRSYHL